MNIVHNTTHQSYFLLTQKRWEQEEQIVHFCP